VTAVPPRRILVVEDHDAMRTLLGGTLRSLGFEVEAVSDARSAIRQMDRFDPDGVVLDIDLGSRPNGVELSHLLRTLAPHLGIVFFTNYPSPQQARGGADLPERSGFVNKESLSDAAELRAAIDASLSDDLPPTNISPDADANPLAALTPTQLAVLADVATGYTNAEIAVRRDSSVSATERLIARIFAALGVANDSRHNARVVATRIYLRHASVAEMSPAP
jgi:DNA-binding NarL/FixJ family response regulator